MPLALSNLFKFGWIDFVDILLVSFLLYQSYLLVRGSVAARILLGILAVVVAWAVVSLLEMELLGNILGQFINVGVIAALILFQSEIRQFLLVIGKAHYFRNLIIRSFFGASKTQVNVNAFVDAAFQMGMALTGALIVFEKDDDLKSMVQHGDEIDAIPSPRLIISIFNKYCPLHDGAMIVGQDGRIAYARCILPLSEDPDLAPELGTRHRAALGVTEKTDAIVLVVSEERGSVSIARHGKLYRNLAPSDVHRKLMLYLTEDRHAVQTEVPR
ncbi:MAG: TIGR00159 family protein [Bacteroidetes bacterium]|nr:MAG: TIGR00159 family protein [Bacteroidota bacterium]